MSVPSSLPPPPAPRASRAARVALVVLALIVAFAVALALAVGAGARRLADVGRWAFFGRDTTAVTQAVVVERTRAVAKLVTAETGVRDVVLYRNRRLGSTKRAIVVVTGKVLTGIDLERGADVRVDHESRRIHLTLPRARVLGVEITELKTFDEQRGLWNPFEPADRDSIFQLARQQLVTAAGEIGVRRQAEQQAQRLLEELLSTDGYSAVVEFRGAVPRDAASPRELSPGGPPRAD